MDDVNKTLGDQVKVSFLDFPVVFWQGIGSWAEVGSQTKTYSFSSTYKIFPGNLLKSTKYKELMEFIT